MGKLTVGKKITGGFVIMIAMVAVMSLFTYSEIGRINGSYEAVIDNNLSKVELAQGFAVSLANESVAMRQFVFTGDLSDAATFNNHSKKADLYLRQMEEILTTEQGERLAQEMKTQKAAYDSLAAQVIQAKRDNNMETVTMHMQEAAKVYQAAMTAADELQRSIKVIAKEEQQQQQKMARMAQLVLLIVNLVIAVAGIGIGLFVSRKIAGPIQLLTGKANEVARGNLLQPDVAISSSDEIGQVAEAFNIMKHNLKQLIQQIGKTTEQVAASSQELTASAEQSAQAANQIAVSIGEVAEGVQNETNALETAVAVVEQMSASIREAAGNAGQVGTVADKTVNAAEQGNKAVDSAVNQMESIERTVAASAGVVAKLGDRSKEIGQIVDTISGIAGQTNLLALNAAIEAARAGEQGKGFAVVAEEVRKLAEQSQDAAQKIAGLIGEIQSETDAAVAAMNDGSREVKVGTEVVHTAGRAFKDIMSLVSEVTAQIKGISGTIQELASSSQQIVESVRNIDQISKNTAGQTHTVSSATEEQLASMQEMAASSQALSKLAEELQGAVRKFNI